jgi:hypothetical protein
MNIGSIIPQVNINIARPEKVSARGNMYKIGIKHTDENGNHVRDYQVWTTKEAVQQHFQGMTDNPKEYQLRKFARQMYEKRMRSTNGAFKEGGMLATSQDITHGNPKLWPHTLSHPEIKI